MPLVNAVSTDKTVNLANVPWVFSLAPSDDLVGETLAAAVAGRASGRSFILVSSDDHDSRQLAGQLAKALQQHQAHASYQYQFQQGSEDLSDLTGKILGARPAALVVIAGADDTARIVSSLRERGYAGTVLGGPAVGRARFLDRAGGAAEGVLFPWLLQSPISAAPRLTPGQADPPGWAGDGSEPVAMCDYTTALTGDAVRMLVDAIRAGGLNRARIRDALADLSPWVGTAGAVRWDGLGRNIRNTSLHRVVRGPQGLTWTD